MHIFYKTAYHTREMIDIIKVWQYKGLLEKMPSSFGNYKYIQNAWQYVTFGKIKHLQNIGKES